jgi:Protein of unknown function (DUF3379)
VNCLDFRRRVGAEPSVEDGQLAAHRASCAACARYQDELRAMDGLIARALAIGTDRLARSAPAQQAPASSRRRLFAIAASVAVGLAVGLALLVGAPRDSVAREVVEHVTHEPGTLAPTAPIAPAALAEVLEPDGARLRPGIGDVTFAARCVVDGRVVPHLVVRTPDGPVTVLLLRHREIDEPLRIAERGLDGVVLPAPRGSIAVVGQGIADLPGVAQRVFEAVDWGA